MLFLSPLGMPMLHRRVSGGDIEFNSAAAGRAHPPAKRGGLPPPTPHLDVSGLFFGDTSCSKKFLCLFFSLYLVLALPPYTIHLTGRICPGSGRQATAWLCPVGPGYWPEHVGAESTGPLLLGGEGLRNLKRRVDPPDPESLEFKQS